ncbi:hypothetical protein GQ600_3300 [Phytophthora cactorum]|nr:hypothetical protein GQ600_3300 [Phytophthora cactorum]
MVVSFKKQGCAWRAGCCGAEAKPCDPVIAASNVSLRENRKHDW